MPPATPPNTARTCAVARRDAQESFFVIESDSAALAGVININDIVRDAEQSGRLGYYAFAPWAGKGLMRAGLELVIGSAFRELGLHRLEANIQPHQPPVDRARRRASVSSAKGTARGFLKIGNRWRDHERWALLKDDWRQRYG